MYDFKYQNHLNTYESYSKTIEKEDSLNKVRKSLFYIVILLFIFIFGMFALTSYQKYNYKQDFTNNQSIPSTISTKISHLQLTEAITQSVVNNLKSQRSLQKINDDELKSIIQKVINRIEAEPSKTKYSQK